MLDKLFSHNPNLVRLFPNSVYPCCTINFGPKTTCHGHVDFGNLPFGLCAITALGDYDPQKGGHIILYDAKMVIEFPPGSTILIPSGAMKHGNTPIAENENRYSMTQYCAGGLFRWVSYGFRTAKKFEDEDEDAKKIVDSQGKERWMNGVKYFSLLSDLISSVHK